MKLTTLPLTLLLALPAAAQDLMPTDRWQIGFGLNDHWEARVETQSGSSRFLRYTRKANWTPSLLANCRALDLGNSYLSVTGEYQFWSRTDLKVDNIGVQGFAGIPSGQSTQAFRSQFWAPGVSWDFRKAVDFGFGLQYRFARLEGDYAKENYNRPWFNAHVGYTFRTAAAVRPFVALRHSLALERTRSVAMNSLGLDAAGQKRLLRALDADAVTSLQVGLRF